MSITCPVCKTTFVSQKETNSLTSIDSVLALFPQDKRAYFDTEVLKGSPNNVWILKIPYVRGEDGRQNWKEINDIVKSNDGKWITAGADSHWELPRKN